MHSLNRLSTAHPAGAPSPTTDPIDFKVRQLPCKLCYQGRLALVGRLFKRNNLPALVDTKYPVRSGIANSDILNCYLGLPTLGKNDFDVVEGFRPQCFAHQALGLRAVPSSATLRQRFDAFGCEWSERADRLNRAILGLHINGAPIDFGALDSGHLPLDIDTFVMDQSDTQKEGVSHTYTGVYGYCLELDLRHGSQHSTFATNHLVCALAALAMNLLRIVGRQTLHERDSPMRKAALRRRSKAVMQEMMCKAARIFSHAQGWVLGMSGSDSGFAVFERAFGCMKTA